MCSQDLLSICIILEIMFKLTNEKVIGWTFRLENELGGGYSTGSARSGTFSPIIFGYCFCVGRWSGFFALCELSWKKLILRSHKPTSVDSSEKQRGVGRKIEEQFARVPTLAARQGESHAREEAHCGQSRVHRHTIWTSSTFVYDAGWAVETIIHIFVMQIAIFRNTRPHLPATRNFMLQNSKTTNY